MTAHEREDYYDPPERDVTATVTEINHDWVALLDVHDDDDRVNGTLTIPLSLLPKDITTGTSLTLTFTRDIPTSQQPGPSFRRDSGASAGTAEYP